MEIWTQRLLMNIPITTQERGAIERLLNIADHDTGQSKRVADFLLAWWNSRTCGGFDFTDLWSLDHAIIEDIFIVIRLISRAHHYPDTYGYGDRFEELVRLWRPHLVKRTVQS